LDRGDAFTGGQGTKIYNRGIVTGPVRPNGANEDLDLERFTLGFIQEEIVVNRTSAGVAPFVTAVPTITGTATVGQTLTSTNGTWSGDATIVYTREWFANNLKIPGATNTTFVLTSAQSGTRITTRVTATNNAGSASATSAPTSAVA
jgi:hypothetical protein